MTPKYVMVNDQMIPSFDNSDEAVWWMVESVNEENCDNHRFSYYDDKDGMENYFRAQENGCCGKFDADVMVNGRLATIGCNYGH